MPLFLPKFGIQDGWKNGIQNIQGKLKAPVVIEAGSYYLVVYDIKKKDGGHACVYFKVPSSRHAAVNKYFKEKNVTLSLNTDNISVQNMQAEHIVTVNTWVFSATV